MAQKRKLTRKQRAAALANLAKARRARFKVKRTAKKRFGKNAGRKIKVLTVSERARRSRAKRRRNPANPIVRRHKRRTLKNKTHVKRHWRKDPKRIAAGRKAARTRKRRRNPIGALMLANPISRAAAKKRAKKAAATRRRNAKKMSHAAKTRTYRKPKRTKASYSAAAKRAAATRKRRAAIKARKKMSPAARRADVHARLYARRHRQIKAGTGKSAYERKMEAEGYAYERRRPRRRKSRRNPLPLAMNPVRRRRHKSRIYNPLPNPMRNPTGLMSKLLGFGLGYAIADMTDRYMATHPLTVAGSSVTDQPAQGQIYDSESVLLPVWSNYYRLGGAAAAIALPLFLSRFMFKQTMQLAAVGAVVRVVGKALTDGVVYGITNMTPSNVPTMAYQLYGGEVAAIQKANVANLSALPAAPPATFAGLPKQLGQMRRPGEGVAPRLVAGHPTNDIRRIGDCGDCASSCSPQLQVSTDPLGDSIGSGSITPMTPWESCCVDDNPNSPWMPVPMGGGSDFPGGSMPSGGGNGSGGSGGSNLSMNLPTGGGGALSVPTSGGNGGGGGGGGGSGTVTAPAPMSPSTGTSTVTTPAPMSPTPTFNFTPNTPR